VGGRSVYSENEKTPLIITQGDNGGGNRGKAPRESDREARKPEKEASASQEGGTICKEGEYRLGPPNSKALRKTWQQMGETRKEKGALQEAPIRGMSILPKAIQIKESHQRKSGKKKNWENYRRAGEGQSPSPETDTGAKQQTWVFRVGTLNEGPKKRSLSPLYPGKKKKPETEGGGLVWKRKRGSESQLKKKEYGDRSLISFIC